MRSIFANAQHQGDEHLKLRWMTLENSLNLQHVITFDAMRQVASFAEGEFSWLSIQGIKGANTGLLLKETQKKQAAQEEEEKKRAATARAAAAEAGAAKGESKGKNGQVGPPPVEIESRDSACEVSPVISEMRNIHGRK